MSLLLSDSLVGLVDERSFEDSYVEEIGSIQINGKKYEVDSFVTDRKVIRLHAIGSPADAIEMLRTNNDMDASISIGGDSFSAKGKVHQLGFEQLPHGGRLVISVILRDK